MQPVRAEHTMQIGVWNYYEELNRDNYMFLHPDAAVGDGLLRPINDLYRSAQAQGIVLQTLDTVRDFRKLDAVLFMDLPDLRHRLVKQAWNQERPDTSFSGRAN
jgi:hypothetical protein